MVLWGQRQQVGCVSPQGPHRPMSLIRLPVSVTFQTPYGSRIIGQRVSIRLLSERDAEPDADHAIWMPMEKLSQSSFDTQSRP